MEKTTQEMLAAIPDEVKAKRMFLMKKNRAKRLEKEQKENQPEFLTQAHKENYEKGMKQIAKWQNSETTLEEIMERQKKREK